jgi:hypothetical protein
MVAGCTDGPSCLLTVFDDVNDDAFGMPRTAPTGRAATDRDHPLPDCKHLN